MNKKTAWRGSLFESHQIRGMETPAFMHGEEILPSFF
jgi:hypothetical protein